MTDTDFDRAHLWHPYTSLRHPLPTYAVAAARGVRLQLEDGREVIDGMASWWCAVHGYNVPELNAAATEQLTKMSHVMFGGLTHAPATELGKRLVSLTPEGLNKVFLADSGSISVEVAMKMAIQYQYARGRKTRTKFMSFRGGYHGDTVGPMSVCDPETGMHALFRGFLPQHHFLDRPPAWTGHPTDGVSPEFVERMTSFFAEHAASSAAFICEPVVQGAGGMRFYHPGYVALLRELCDAFDCLLILDEIATGFGRTGTLFACEHAAVVPDILCLGKALTGGYLTLAATLCTDRVADAIGNSDVPNIMHGPTFMGNPLACAVAVASIDLLLADDAWHTRVERLQSSLARHLRTAPPNSLDMDYDWTLGLSENQRELIGDVRVLGGIGVIETTRPADVAKIQAFFVDRGVWIRPFGRLIYVMPPYVATDEEIAQLCEAMYAACDCPDLFFCK